LLDLERAFPQACQVAELRYFAGMTEPEVSLALGISVAKVKSEWKLAKAWLLSELSQDQGEGSDLADPATRTEAQPLDPPSSL
jgi:DNA-directed RNA polymerase specialized sigma24 family protein